MALQAVASEKGRDAPGDEPARPGPPATVPMASFGQGRDEAGSGTRSKVYIGVALLAALLVAGLVYVATRPKASVTDPRLEGAIRPGTAEFEQVRNQVVLEFDPDENAIESPRGIGDIVMTMTPTVRNLTGRTVSGLEIHAAVVDLDGNVLKERTVVRRSELQPFKVVQIPINVEGFKPGEVRANIKMELTGVTFK